MHRMVLTVLTAPMVHMVPTDHTVLTALMAPMVPTDRTVLTVPMAPMVPTDRTAAGKTRVGHAQR